MPSIINNRVGSLANLSLRSSLAMSNIWRDIPIEPQSMMGPHKLTAVAIWPWFFTNAIATYPQLFKALPFSQLSAGGHSQTHGAACKLQNASPISAIQKIMPKLFRFRIWKSSQLARAIHDEEGVLVSNNKRYTGTSSCSFIAMIFVTPVSRSQRFTFKRFAG
jgi:hypothetical protein